MEIVVEMFRKLGLRQVLVTKDGYAMLFFIIACERGQLNQFSKFKPTK